MLKGVLVCAKRTDKHAVWRSRTVQNIRRERLQEWAVLSRQQFTVHGKHNDTTCVLAVIPPAAVTPGGSSKSSARRTRPLRRTPVVLDRPSKDALTSCTSHLRWNVGHPRAGCSCSWPFVERATVRLEESTWNRRAWLGSQGDWRGTVRNAGRRKTPTGHGFRRRSLLLSRPMPSCALAMAVCCCWGSTNQHQHTSRREHERGEPAILPGAVVLVAAAVTARSASGAAIAAVASTA